MQVLQMDTKNDSNIATKPVRHIAITGITAKSCKKIKRLLKSTTYYCVVDCYKSTKPVEMCEAFYLPDYVILEISSLPRLLFLQRRIQNIKDLIPGIKVILYYNMQKKYPLLQQWNKQYAVIFATDDDQQQVLKLETALGQQH